MDRTSRTMLIRVRVDFFALFLISFFIHFYFIKLKKYCFWLCHGACRILVLQPGIKPVSPAVEEQSPNHWTTKEVTVP